MTVPNMWPRPMTKVVAQSSKLNASYMLICDTQRRLTLLEMLSHHPGQVTNACLSPSAEQPKRCHRSYAPRQCSNLLWDAPGYTWYEIPSCLTYLNRWKCGLGENVILGSSFHQKEANGNSRVYKTANPWIVLHYGHTYGAGATNEIAVKKYQSCNTHHSHELDLWKSSY